VDNRNAGTIINKHSFSKSITSAEIFERRMTGLLSAQMGHHHWLNKCYYHIPNLLKLAHRQILKYLTQCFSLVGALAVITPHPLHNNDHFLRDDKLFDKNSYKKDCFRLYTL